MIHISFIYPQFLWLLLLIPLTIGLARLGQRGLTNLRKWGGLGLRVLLLALIVSALAGIQLRRPANSLSAVFMLDLSDSISPAEQQAGEAFIRQAVQEMPSGDRAAIVVFGQDALVERLASEENGLPRLASVPVTTRTDIAGALQLALALFPDEGAKRMVLLSDGRENLGHALEQAELAAAHGIELRYVALGNPQGQAEVYLESLEAPADVRKGQDFELIATAHSSLAQAATLRVFSDGDLISTQEVELHEGSTRMVIPVEAGETGFRRFRAQIVPEQDTRLQNNEASAFAVVHGPPRVLVVEGQPQDGANLAEALQAAEMDVTRIRPSALPNTLPELAAYEAVILVNVPASALSPDAMQALPVYVRDLGRGLVMVGGQDSFGAGGYLRTPLEAALPVDMDVKSKELEANLALVLAVDKSGSMGRCHCDNPDLNQSYTRQEVGQSKVDIAKEAIMRSANALGPRDYLGVVAFDSQARWVLPVKTLVDPFTLEQSIGSFQAEGQTNLLTGVEAAYQALEGVNARRKHIILMTDGWVREGDLTDLARKMQAEGITLSVVAAGGGSAEYLSGLSQVGGGSYYPAVDILSVPDIFLKETVKSVGEYIIEEPFYPLPDVPSPVLHGLDAADLPPLLGYNGTNAKNTARLDLLTPRGDPLLASWQYGLGRAAAWTSDLKGQWARQWVDWAGFGRFVSQLVGWTLPAPQVEGLTAQASAENGQAVIRLQAADADGRPLNFLKAQATLIDPDLGSRQIDLEQVGAGEYQAQAEASQPGTYLVRLGVNQKDQSLGQLSLGLVVPYSPEYRTSGVDRTLLGELARRTGGGELLEPLQAFLHNLPAVDYAREIWRPLLLLAALLFPLDVALRRVVVGRSDWVKARFWVSDHLPGRQRRRVEGPPLLGQLFQARERARRGRRSGVEEAETQERPPVDLPPDLTREKPVKRRPEQSQGGEDSFSRLRQAKNRARRK